MDYKAAIHTAVESVRAEGRYRVFADLKRHRGDFPMATWTPPSLALRAARSLEIMPPRPRALLPRQRFSRAGVSF